MNCRQSRRDARSLIGAADAAQVPASSRCSPTPAVAASCTRSSRPARSASAISPRPCEMSESNVSHHLRALRAHGLVRARREGKMVFYSPDDEHIRLLLDLTREHVARRRSGGERAVTKRSLDSAAAAAARRRVRRVRRRARPRAAARRRRRTPSRRTSRAAWCTSASTRRRCRSTSSTGTRGASAPRRTAPCTVRTASTSTAPLDFTVELPDEAHVEPAARPRDRHGLRRLRHQAGGSAAEHRRRGRRGHQLRRLDTQGHLRPRRPRLGSTCCNACAASATTPSRHSRARRARRSSP